MVDSLGIKEEEIYYKTNTQYKYYNIIADAGATNNLIINEFMQTRTSRVKRYKLAIMNYSAIYH